MAKLRLVANPTFQAKVGIPIAGGESVDVLMTFKHRTKTDLYAFVSDASGKEDIDLFMAMVSGWELEDEFTRENAATLLENYHGAGLATFRVYIDQLMQAKLGN